MSEIKVDLIGYGSHTINLDIHDPATQEWNKDVWKATFCDLSTGDCQLIYFEADEDCEQWDIIDEAIQTYRKEIGEI
jgi:hypothetical protein